LTFGCPGHNAWWGWRNRPDLLHITLLGKELCLCSFTVCECMGLRIEVQDSANKAFNSFQAILAHPSKWRPWHVPCLPCPRYAAGGNMIKKINSNSLDKKKLNR